MKAEIKKLAKKYNKKIGGESIKEINKMLNIELNKILKFASRKADFAGRITIKKEDL